MLLVSHARAERSPEWIVSNGETSVGPVPTALLVRGIHEGRIPDDCWVREAQSEAWRRLHEIREVRALYRGDDVGISPAFQRAEQALSHASDFGELLLLLLHGAAKATRSKVGALHRFRAPVELPVTSCVIGISERRLGEVIAGDDPALRQALSGEPVFGSPDDGYLERHIAERLLPGGDLVAIAMIPVLYGNEVIGMFELGRRDHAFRQTDKDALLRLCALASARTEEL